VPYLAVFTDLVMAGWTPDGSRGNTDHCPASFTPATVAAAVVSISTDTSKNFL
jgi:hypothetical protein